MNFKKHLKLIITDGHQNSPQTTLSAPAWGWTVWGCVQKFNPSLLIFFYKFYPIS